MSKCVAAEFLFDDGKVMHVGEEGAEQAAIRGLNISTHLVKSSYPLRKVTEVRACHCRYGYDSEGLWEGDFGVVRCEDKLLPPEILGTGDNVDGPLCDFRIIVEAVPVTKEEEELVR